MSLMLVLLVFVTSRKNNVFLDFRTGPSLELNISKLFVNRGSLFLGFLRLKLRSLTFSFGALSISRLLVIGRWLNFLFWFLFLLLFSRFALCFFHHLFEFLRIFVHLSFEGLNMLRSLAVIISNDIEDFPNHSETIDLFNIFDFTAKILICK